MTFSRNLSLLAQNVNTSGAVSSISNGTSNVSIGSANSNVTITTANVTAITVDTSQNATLVGNMAMGSSFLRNRLINGNMYIAQRATSATVTAGTAVPTASTGYPCVDRFFVYSTGANVTAAQVAGSGANKNLLQITGAASVTAVGIGQRIEQLNSYDLAGQTCTLSVSIANSLLTTVTWTASYATTADTFGTIGTPTKTQIATGTFTVNSTLTQYTTNISVPAAATTGIEILFTVGAQTSGTWQIGNVQFEAGSIATPFERQIYSNQLSQCQRYYYKAQANPSSLGTTFTYGGYSYSATNAAQSMIPFPTTMRANPTSTQSGISLAQLSGNWPVTVIAATTSSTTQGSLSFQIGSSSLTTGQGVMVYSTTAGNYIDFSAEL
jgi:hypothetical protein